MANIPLNSLIILLSCILFVAATATATAEKSTHLHFYMHDTATGPNPTAVKIVSSPSNATAFAFGAVVAIDDPLTEGPNVSSKLVGRAQGFYSLASQQGLKLLWTVNLLLTEGKYNGSSLAVVGSDDIPLPVRELPVVGGTGRFRLARGYILVRTYWIDNVGDAILEIDAHVWHH